MSNSFSHIHRNIYLIGAKYIVYVLCEVYNIENTSKKCKERK